MLNGTLFPIFDIIINKLKSGFNIYEINFSNVNEIKEIIIAIKPKNVIGPIIKLIATFVIKKAIPLVLKHTIIIGIIAIWAEIVITTASFKIFTIYVISLFFLRTYLFLGFFSFSNK